MQLFSRARSGDVLDVLLAAGRNAAETTQALRGLVASFPERHDIGTLLVDREHEGDRLTHEAIRLLRTQPARRNGLDVSDGHALATAIDDIVDHAEQVGDHLGLYRIEAPMAQADELSQLLADAAEQVARALGRLKRGAGYEQELVEIHRLENEGDRVARAAMAALFEIGIDPMVVIRWKDIFDGFEQAIDSCERVAHVLEGIALRNGR